MARDLRVVVIGGGIAGLVACRALVRRGFDVRAFEAAPELREIGAGVALDPNAMKALRSLGLEEAVRAVAGRGQWELLRAWNTGRVIARSERRVQAQRYGAANASAHRADLLDVLAASLPAGLVTLGARCVDVDAGGEVVRARFEDGGEVEADVIIGADGIHSKVRESLFGTDAPRFTGKICYRSVIPADAVAPAAPGESGDSTWMGPHGAVILYWVRRDELINVVCHYDDPDYRHESWISECDRQEVLDRYSGWHESLLRLFAAGERWYKWALYDRDPIPRWTSGRVTLVGDAAHPMLPYLGQGACQAIEDGCVLAAALAEQPDDPAAALERYERSRRPHASRVVLAARERGESNHLTSPLAIWRRDLAITLRRTLRHDLEGRGTSWILDYDAGSSSALVA